MIEVDKNFLNLLTYDGTTTNKKLPILHHKLLIRSLGGKIQEMRVILLELTMRGVEGVKGVHELLLMLPSFLSLPSFNLSSNPSLL